MHLYLLRHAEAMASADNPNRPLTAHGHEQVAKLIQQLPGSMQSIDAIYHSGILRAEETAVLVAQALDLVDVLRPLAVLGENGSVPDFMQDLSAWAGDTLIVSHFPFLTELLATLIGGEAVKANHLLFSTATLMCLVKSEDEWHFEWVI